MIHHARRYSVGHVALQGTPGCQCAQTGVWLRLAVIALSMTQDTALSASHLGRTRLPSSERPGDLYVRIVRLGIRP